MNSTIKVLSFDLDDALYDNKPVLIKAEKLCTDFLEQQFMLQSQSFDIKSFYALRHRLMHQNDPKMENMTLMRQVAINEVCETLENSELIAREALAIFLDARSQATIPQEIVLMMERLSRQYILVSVTNGNCDPNKLSIGKYFNKNYSPVEGFRAKPHPEMLQKVVSDLNIEKSQLLHIGDSLDKDCAAAKAAGTHFFHFAPFDGVTGVEQTVIQFENYLKTFLS